jgi:hypothetical protein
MRIGDFDRYAPLKTALNEAGFKVDEVEKRDKRTVITVIPRKKMDKRLGKPKSLSDLA